MPTLTYNVQGSQVRIIFTRKFFVLLNITFHMHSLQYCRNIAQSAPVSVSVAMRDPQQATT